MARSNAGRSTTGEAKVPYYRGSDRVEAAKHLRLTVTRYIAERANLSDIEEAMDILRSVAEALRKEFEAQGGRGVDLAEHIDELEADLEVSFQESIPKKVDWLKATKRRFPAGTRVRVVKSDVPEYVGLKGTVADYSLGSRGDWPLIGVKFDGLIKTSEWSTAVNRDSFYDDEIVVDRKKGKR